MGVGIGPPLDRHFPAEQILAFTLVWTATTLYTSASHSIVREFGTGQNYPLDRSLAQ
jgi:hypothetical protein